MKRFTSICVGVFLTIATANLHAGPTPLPNDPACTPEDREFTVLASAVARKAVEQGSRPFGAVVVKDGKVIAEFGNS